MRLIFIITGCALTFLTHLWFCSPLHVVSEGTAKVASVEVKRAMLKMGPMKDYRIMPDGKLQVKVDGKWLRLKY